ncbi:hypothetical protein BC937DRAFT_87834 [Endogone sp. FLAS-F59071]|nr:hypothetical protein BC937DRAFT_87834 [Endogone sp. FLAS-F59071]|eukprot:RUS19213.1 hypothetical protein BC937DRAFT_87834 [Endogone sp. FLAS-F59071]
MLQSFFHRSDFPPGSAHLRLYSGMFAKFTEIPGQAKRDRIYEIMRDFPMRRFVLVGDSGEIDLEIYTRIALEYPGRIIAIFIRDVTTRAFLARLDKEQERAQAQAAAAQTIQGVGRTRSFPLSFGTPNGSGASSSSLVSTHSAPSPVDLFGAWSSGPQILAKTPESEHFPVPARSSPRQIQRSSSFSSTGGRPSRFGITSLKHALWYERFELSVPPPFPTSSMSTSAVTPTATIAAARSEPSRSFSASSLPGLSRSSTASSLVAAAAPVKNEVDILNDKIRKAKAELEGKGVKVVLFKEAQVLKESKEVEEALRKHGERKAMRA